MMWSLTSRILAGGCSQSRNLNISLNRCCSVGKKTSYSDRREYLRNRSSYLIITSDTIYLLKTIGKRETYNPYGSFFNKHNIICEAVRIWRAPDSTRQNAALMYKSVMDLIAWNSALGTDLLSNNIQMFLLLWII